LWRSSAAADGAPIVEEQNSQALLLLLVRSVVGSSTETPVSMGRRRCVGRVGRWRERRD
jgi:hypothetical protein